MSVSATSFASPTGTGGAATNMVYSCVSQYGNMMLAVGRKPQQVESLRGFGRVMISGDLISWDTKRE